MARVLAILLLAGGLAQLCGTACAAPGRGNRKLTPEDRWKIQFKLSLDEREGKWSFTVQGTTDLPAATVLRAQVYAVNVVMDPNAGPVEDEEPLVRGDDDQRPSFKSFKAGIGWFHEEVHTFRRKPYSLRYRARVQYVPDDQTDAITLKVGDTEFSRPADLRVGSDESYEAELKERVVDATADLLLLERLGGELKEWMGKPARAPRGWDAWREGAATAIAALQAKNRERFDIWTVWSEYQTRMRVRGLCGFLDRIILEVDDRGSDPARTRKWMAGFEDSFGDAIMVIGIDPPLEARAGSAAVAAYETAVAPLRDGYGRRDIRRRVRADGVAALFDLLRLLRTRQRAYVYVNTISLRLLHLFELMDEQAGPDALAAAFREHDASLRDFRRFAGLP
jgi:hypothetical protein